MLGAVKPPRMAIAPCLLIAIVCGAAEGHTAPTASSRREATEEAQATSGASTGRDGPIEWAAHVSSPRPLVPEGSAAARDRLARLLARCGRGEAGLEEVAQRVVASRLAGRPHLDLAALTFLLRAAGEPHVWPHAWVISGRPLDPAATEAKLEAWGATFQDAGDRRCGVASGVANDGTEVTAAVALDALADLSPLPIEVQVGMWLTVDARLLVPVTDAHVIVQGPASDPRSVPSWVETAKEDGLVHLRARFAPDRPGPLTAQVVADVGTGPRPILEARLFADVSPPDRFDRAIAPGEDARPPGPVGTSADHLLAMVGALRDAERLRPLARDPSLDDVALAHAHRMLTARTVGHDVGDGDPEDRVLAAGVRARLVGENVAHAASIRLAHRALYDSPSHRANLLRAEFDRVGAAVLADADGSVWVAEVFAAGPR
jgi:uncharacterized protein YkwD